MKHLKPFNESNNIDYANDIFNIIRDEHPEMSIYHHNTQFGGDFKPYDRFIMRNVNTNSEKGYLEFDSNMVDILMDINNRLKVSDLLYKPTEIRGLDCSTIPFDALRKNIEDFESKHDLIMKVYFFIKKQSQKHQ